MERLLAAINEAAFRMWQENHEFLLLEANRKRGYYVQFARSRDDPLELTAEAVSDALLADRYQLGVQGGLQLQLLGWHTPNGASHPNWWRRFEVRTTNDLAPAVELAAQTLAGVFGSTPRRLKISVCGDLPSRSESRPETAATPLDSPIVKSDELQLKRALHVAAGTMRPSRTGEPGEKRDLEPAVRVALENEFGAGIVRVGLRVRELPDWSPQPGGVDVVVLNGRGDIHLGLELKIYKLDETIWDVFKMASLARMPNVAAAYVAAAANQPRWHGESDGAALFASPPHETKEWDTASFFDAWPRAWQGLLDGGSGRPTRVPERLILTVVGDFPMTAWPGWSVRLVRVENPREAGWLVLDGWPIGYQPRPPKHGSR